MARLPNREHPDAATQHPKEPFNWGCIALGGCLGLILLASPVILMVGGMAYSDWQVNRNNDRTPEASELVCHEVAPAVVARIEAGLTDPGLSLRGVRAVHSAEDPEDWWVGAEVPGIGHEVDSGVAVWRLKTRGDPRTGEGAPEAAIATAQPDRDTSAGGDEDGLASQNYNASWESNFPGLNAAFDRPDLEDAAIACTVAALDGD
jgi:hypothetical protein